MKAWYYTHGLKQHNVMDHRVICPNINNQMSTPTIIPRSEHGISRSEISESALKVLYRLNKAGYAAYLVGGAVRDLLLERHPKDFDVATDARPEEVHALFRNSRLIGRRFRLAHIRFGREIIEVATFRAAHDDAHTDHAHQTDNGRLVRDNVYGDIDGDVWRRDLTVNALFYNIKDFSIVDYVDGMSDVANKIIRVVGEPEQRYREDPVRMLRALRFVAKLGFEIDSTAAGPIGHLAPLLDEIPAARLYDEVLKLFQKGHALRSFEVLREYKLLGYLFLQVEESLNRDQSGYLQRLITHGLENTDRRILESKSVNPAFLYAFLLWGALKETLQASHGDINHPPSVIAAAREVFSAQVEQTSIPKRFSIQAREIWALQPRFEQRRGKRPLRFFSHPRFRAAYDFLLLRSQAGEDLQELCDWWTDFQETDEVKQVGTVRTDDRGRRRPRRRRSPQPKTVVPTDV